MDPTDDGRPRGAFERMIGRRTTPRAGQGQAGPSPAEPIVSPASPGGAFGGQGGPSPRLANAASARRGSGPQAGGFPSAPVGYTDFASGGGGNDGYGQQSPRSPGRRMGRGSPRSRNRRGGRNSFYDGGDVEDDDDMADFAPMSGGNSHQGRGGGGDFELQPASWAEDAVEEIYGCDPSAAVYAVGQSSMGGGGPASRGTSRAGSSRGAMSPFDVDDDGYALPSPSARPKRAGGSSSGGGGGGGGGKTRTRCRGLGGGNPLAENGRGRTAFGAQPSAFAQSGPLTSSGAAGPKNKKLQRKTAQSLPFRRRSELVTQRRARGDTSDDSDGEISAEVYLVAPSPAAGPARAPAPVPGQFVLPLQAEVEESTELLFMSFELC